MNRYAKDFAYARKRRFYCLRTFAEAGEGRAGNRSCRTGTADNLLRLRVS